MMDGSIRRFVLFFIVLFVLSACGSQAPAVQATPSSLLSTPSLTATLTPAPTDTATATPCLGFIATPRNTPPSWSYADDYWNNVAISRIPVQGMECSAPQEIVSKLLLLWFETIKTNSTAEHCGLEEYTLDSITVKQNFITPQYEIVASVHYHIKPGRFAACSGIVGHGVFEKDGWIRTSDVFGVYRENGYFRLIVLPGWGT